MPTLTLHRKQWFERSIPYWIFVNGQPIGTMLSREVSIQMPEGEYELGVRIVLAFFRWRFQIGGCQTLTLGEGQHMHLHISDRERWWNLLFNIDLLVWLGRLFIDLPYPWNIIYEVASDGFFLLWIARIWLIRDRYFQFKPLED